MFHLELMFASLFQRKGKAEDQLNYSSSFRDYGVIGEFGGFQEHALRVAIDKDRPFSDLKYRTKEANRLGVVFANRCLRGHIHPVLSVCWSPTDPTLICSVGKDSKMISWNAVDASKQSAVQGGVSGDIIMTCGMNYANSIIVCGGIAGMCSVVKRDVRNGTLSSPLESESVSEHEGYISSCVFLDDSRFLTASGDGTVKLFDLNSSTVGSSCVTFTHDTDVACAVPQNAGSSVFFSATSNEIWGWDARASSAARGQEMAQPCFKICSPTESDWTSLDVCKNKDFLLCTGNEAGEGYVFDIRRCHGHHRSTSSISSSSASSIAPSLADGREGSGVPPVTLCSHRDITQAVSSVAFSHCGSLVFAGYRKWVKNYMDCVLAVFDVSAAASALPVAEAAAEGGLGGSRQHAGWGTSNSNSNSNSNRAAASLSESEEHDSSLQKNTAGFYVDQRFGDPEEAPHCIIGDNPGITSSVPYSYSYQPGPSTFVSTVKLNCDGCILAAASHDGNLTLFRQQR
jgi:hypothetical protein